jgi:predicted RNase H-like HicB family nuclease
MKFKVILRRDTTDGGYVARCPALPGCVSQGETKAEALANIREAIEGVVLVLNERARKSSAGDQLIEVEV